jgi:hypothetical protein
MRPGQNLVAVTLELFAVLIKWQEDFMNGNVFPDDMYQEGEDLLKHHTHL